MEYIVQIGTDEQQQAIWDELSILDGIVKELHPSSVLIRVVVPTDFDAMVNELQNTTTYTSSRGQLAIAKTLCLESETVIVLSPHLYTYFFDHQSRVSIYLHELFHCINREKFKYALNSAPSHGYYLENSKILFDEYYANRKSFEIINGAYKQKSQRYKILTYGSLKGHIQTLIDSAHYNTIRTQISQFRIHGNVNIFLRNCQPPIDELMKSMVYSYAIMDSHKHLYRLDKILTKSMFINNNTARLIDYFRTKYASDDFDLNDGIVLMEKVLIGYGLMFKDTAQGRMYCHVLDI